MIVGLFVRGIKVYQNINFIPFLALGDEHYIAKNKFISYIGANGSGKSSILEALNSFFNRMDDIEKKDYNINKNITPSSYGDDKNPFVVPIFLIKKSKIQGDKNIQLLEELSNYLWSVESSIVNNSNPAKESYDKFFDMRDKLKQLQTSHYLLALGERPVSNGVKNLAIDSVVFVKEKFKDDDENKTFRDQEQFKSILEKIKQLYSYVYLPVEANAQDFTKLETSEMQKLIGKKLKDEIENILQNNKIVQKINDQLNPLLLKVEEYLKDYTYKQSNTKQQVKNYDLIPKIIEAYFETKYLRTKSSPSRLVEELSAGEKRKALIAVISAFLENRNENELDKDVIIAVDEPENSLHTSLCYEQFEKLHKISEKAQVLITTHWYGFLPIINYGYAHFLTKNSGDKVSFDSYSLYNYKSKIKKDIEQSKNKIMNDFQLKSNYDLVQSIYHSLIADKPYNWLLVEGITDKLYLESFLDKNKMQELNLKILPLGGCSKVAQVFKFLILPLKEFAGQSKGKVYCLIDTDDEGLKIDDYKELNNLHFRRLSHKNSNENVELLKIDDSNNKSTSIEECLNPTIFKETYDTFNNQEYYKDIQIKNEKGNTNFSKNLDAINELEDFFATNEGQNKVDFCRKYIEIFESKENKAEFVPKWINEIKKFFES